jgi:hypothetical protein
MQPRGRKKHPLSHRWAWDPCRGKFPGDAVTLVTRVFRVFAADHQGRHASLDHPAPATATRALSRQASHDARADGLHEKGFRKSSCQQNSENLCHKRHKCHWWSGFTQDPGRADDRGSWPRTPRGKAGPLGLEISRAKKLSMFGFPPCGVSTDRECRHRLRLCARHDSGFPLRPRRLAIALQRRRGLLPVPSSDVAWISRFRIATARRSHRRGLSGAQVHPERRVPGRRSMFFFLIAVDILENKY